MANHHRIRCALRLEELEPRQAPTVSPWATGLLLRQSFDGTVTGTIPATWSKWTNQGTVAVSATRAYSPTNGLALTSTSTQSARAWSNQALPRDIQAGAEVYVSSLVPAQVFVRGQGLAASTPTYYAVSISRGLQVSLVRVLNGTTSTLGQVKSASYLSNIWVYASIYANGSNLRAQIYRPDTAQYLDSSGQWQSAVVWALNVTNSEITSGGMAGLNKPASYSGTVNFDDFTVIDFRPPSVRITTPSAGTTVISPLTVQASASDNVGVSRVDFYLDGIHKATDSTGPYTWQLNPASVAAGTHTLLARAYDAAGNMAQTSVTIHTAVVTMPTIPRHYTHIRIAELAYSGTPFGTTEQQLLRNSVDLVVSNPNYLSDIDSVAPNTPQLVYLNTSNIYRELLTDWLKYADAHGLNREGALYHVSKATAFSGDSSSSLPVNRFWGVYSGGLPDFVDVTSSAGSSAGTVPFGDVGTSIYIGYPDRFREINITLATLAANGWKAVIEYPTGVDAYGNPTSWSTLSPFTETTNGLTRSGQILFDPPSNWRPISINGSARFYYVRFRTTASGTAPVANTILGRDYVNARGTTSGIIPAFDAAADLNHDGYLNDAEYAHRAPGHDARFLYESRVFYGVYGQMRFATNPSNAGFQNWAADYAVRFLRSNPQADGIFMDNATGKPPVAGTGVLEATSTYASDYGALLNYVGQAIAPHWIMANTSGGGTTSDSVVGMNTAYYEEFAIRPLTNNYQQFEDLAALVTHRAALRSPSPYAILDSLPTGGSPTDPRTQIATLAYYYLIADPNTTFLNFYGGYEPATTWSRHWSPAAAYNIGQPTSTWSVFATNTDPSNSALTYRVYQRTFTNALVLYKPLSYAPGTTASATLSSSSATTHLLGGTYRPLRADGTLGAPVTSITLRNGEGAILIK